MDFGSALSLANSPANPTSMSTPEETEYPALFLRGIEYFNECEFYEAHDVWEELWAEYRGPSREFFQGLIQVAVALHHFGNGNLGGARKLYRGSCKYLERYRPRHLGVDLEKLLAEFEACLQEVLADENVRRGVEIDVEKIPEIHLDPSPR